MKVKISNYVSERIARVKKDFRVDAFICGGNGGQNLQKTMSGARITDLKTGLSVECTEERKFLQNRKRAFTRLVLKLIKFYEEEENKLKEETKKEYRVIRTYHKNRNEVVDHRSGAKNSYKNTLEGDISLFIISMMRVNNECNETTS